MDNSKERERFEESQRIRQQAKRGIETGHIAGSKDLHDYREKQRKEERDRENAEEIKNHTKVNSGSSSSGSCFIATAAFGSYDCDEVRIFRKFRDEKLKPNLVGRTLISTYYKLGPFLATPVEKSAILQRIVRRVLESISKIL